MLARMKLLQEPYWRGPKRKSLEKNNLFLAPPLGPTGPKGPRGAKASALGTPPRLRRRDPGPSTAGQAGGILKIPPDILSELYYCYLINFLVFLQLGKREGKRKKPEAPEEYEK
jgi:hypothetical protein